MGGGRKAVRDLLLVLVIHMVHQRENMRNLYYVFAENVKNSRIQLGFEPKTF